MTISTNSENGYLSNRPKWAMDEIFWSELFRIKKSRGQYHEKIEIYSNRGHINRCLIVVLVVLIITSNFYSPLWRAENEGTFLPKSKKNL